MSKQWTKLPRGMSWKQINIDRRKRIRKTKFVDGLKYGDELVTIDFETLTHDGTDFTVISTGTREWSITCG